MTDWLPIVAALVVAPITAYATVRMSKPKVRADATSTITATALTLIEPQKRIIEDLRCRIVSLEGERNECHKELAALREWVHDCLNQKKEE